MTYIPSGGCVHTLPARSARIECGRIQALDTRSAGGLSTDVLKCAHRVRGRPHFCERARSARRLSADVAECALATTAPTVLAQDVVGDPHAEEEGDEVAYEADDAGGK